MDGNNVNVLNYFFNENGKSPNEKENQNTPIISNQESLLNPSKQATTYNTTGQNTTFLSSSTNPPPAPSASQNQTNVNINNSYSTYPVTPYPNTVINPTILPNNPMNPAYYNGKFPYNGEVFSYSPPNNIIQQNAQNPVPFQPLPPTESLVYPTQVDPSYIQPSQPPIISPYFNQSSFNPYNQFPMKTPLQPLQQFSYGMIQPSVKPSSSLLNSPSAVSQISNIITPTVEPEESKEKESILANTSELEETKEIKLSRDRAAARLRRMRKKTIQETSELRIAYVKEKIQTIKTGEITKDRKGLYSVLEWNSDMIFSYEERVNQFYYVLQVWKYLLTRQQEFDLLMKVLLWSTIEEEGENTHTDFRKELHLSEEQKTAILALLPQWKEYHHRLDIVNWCMLTLSMNVNLLLIPVIDKGNDIFNASLTSNQIQKLHAFFRQNEQTIAQLPIFPSKPSVSSNSSSEVCFTFN